ncbi:MAG: POTRA domain-containing protein [Bryobacteraceae bacterium]
MFRISAQSGYPIETIAFGGTEYPRDALLGAAGLHSGMPFNEAVLREAAQRLQSTGFFRSVQFRYQTAADRKGYAVRFDLIEDTDRMPARIDIPGIDEDAAWAALQAADPLLTKQAPANDVAQARYLHAIEEYVAQHADAQKIAARVNGGELGSQRAVLVFEPENLKVIAAVRFTDTYALKPADLEAALEPIAAGSGYTEARFRQLLNLNVRPLFEEQGFLGVVFDRIRLREDDSGRLTVETHVVDGRKYNLSAVTLDGPDLPEAQMRQAAKFRIGELADWKQFLQSVSEMERVLKRQGYLGEKSRVERTLHSREGTVDAVVHFNPGPQYRFGRLELSGLADDVKTMAEQRWTLRSGQPLNGEYPHAFLHDLYQELRASRARAAVSFRPGDGENVLDVVIAFR